jgi:hypothetical protein
MTPEPIYRRGVRILRNLKINEVSGVDRGAGHGVKIMLMKREEERAMPTIGVHTASNIFKFMVDMTAARNPTWTLSKCHDVTLREPLAREAFELSLLANREANSIEKMDSSDGAWSRLETGPTQHPPAPSMDHSGAGQRSLSGYGATQTTGVAELQRLRQAHAHKALLQHNEDVEKLVATGMKRSAAHSQVMASNPERWGVAKEAKGFAPLSHDANAIRAT